MITLKLSTPSTPPRFDYPRSAMHIKNLIPSILLPQMLLTFVACLAVPFESPAVDTGIPLVNNRQPVFYLVTPEHPNEHISRAASEIAAHVQLMCGQRPNIETLPAATDPNSSQLKREGMIPVTLGVGSPETHTLLKNEKVTPDSFALVATKEGIHIAALSGEGVENGAYELLEQLGVRWFMPGNFGRFLPDGKNLMIRPQETLQIPSFEYRQLQHIGDNEWTRRNRLGGTPRSTGSHDLPPFKGDKAVHQFFETNPEYFALVDGERVPSQMNIGHPDVLKKVVESTIEYFDKNPDAPNIGMGGRDSGQHRYDQSADSTVHDRGVHDPLFDAESMSDRYVWFLNQVLKGIEHKYPDKRIATYVYARHMMPPKITPDPRITPVFAPITLDRIRGMDNPMSPDRHILKGIIEGWAAFKPHEMVYRGYYNNLACIQAPFSQVHRIRSETPYFKKVGINAMRVEVIQHGWATSGPSIYLAARMMWNADLDVDAVIADFHEKFFGPAAKAMAGYHELLDSAYRDTPYFAGSSYPLPLIFTAERRAPMRKLLDEAVANVDAMDPLEKDQTDWIHQDRVEAFIMAFDRLEQFLEMQEKRNAFDFAAAKKAHDAFQRISDDMAGMILDPEPKERDSWSMRLLNFTNRSDNPRSMFNRFFAAPVLSGYHRTVEAGELVASLPLEWDFLLDPTGLGEMAGYSREGKLGGNWQRLKTTPETWSDQGLHYYKGEAWYRTSVVIPESFKDREIYLWFGGVDEYAKVWVNGRPLGSSTDPGEGLPGFPRAFNPFDLRATDAVRFGANQPNWIAVQIKNERLDEQGTGGIMAPAMFWSPKNPDWTPETTQ